jgi:hypothetical protein
MGDAGGFYKGKAENPAGLGQDDGRGAWKVFFNNVTRVVDHLRILRSGDRENVVAIGVGEGHEMMQAVFGEKSRIHVIIVLSVWS